jgi:hypothetical protein
MRAWSLPYKIGAAVTASEELLALSRERSVVWQCSGI